MVKVFIHYVGDGALRKKYKTLLFSSGGKGNLCN